jgi:hypothetical protein
MDFVSVDEYLMNRGSLEELSDEIVRNINTLIPRVNELLERFGEKRNVTSGLRRMEDHIRIYEEINAKRRAKGLPEQKVPMGSKHLIGAAIDLEDKNDKLKEFCVKNTHILKELGLYMEDPSATDTWCHLQCIPPGSGKTVFRPF